MDPAPQRAFDIHPTVERLRNDVGKLRTPRTAQHFEEALRDLAVFPPWDQAEPGTLARDFLATVERLDPKTRKVVRLTLGLDEATETLTQRRAMHRSDSTGGSGHIAPESYALAKALTALLVWRGGPPASPLREKSLAGFVIREADVAATLSASGLRYSIKVRAECQEDGARAMLVPAPWNLGRLKVFTAQIWHGDTRRKESGKPAGEIHYDRVEGFGRACYLIPLSPCSIGDRIEVDLSTPPLKKRDALRLTGIRAIWWRSFGTEERVRLQMKVSRNLVAHIAAYEMEGASQPSHVPAPIRTPLIPEGGWKPETWSVTQESPTADHLTVIEWRPVVVLSK